jgi:hypothetical protein
MGAPAPYHFSSFPLVGVLLLFDWGSFFSVLYGPNLAFSLALSECLLVLVASVAAWTTALLISLSICSHLSDYSPPIRTDGPQYVLPRLGTSGPRLDWRPRRRARAWISPPPRDDSNPFPLAGCIQTALVLALFNWAVRTWGLWLRPRHPGPVHILFGYYIDAWYQTAEAKAIYMSTPLALYCLSAEDIKLQRLAHDTGSGSDVPMLLFSSGGHFAVPLSAISCTEETFETLPACLAVDDARGVPLMF